MLSSVTRCSRVSHAPAQMWVRTQTTISISSLIPAPTCLSSNSVLLKGAAIWRFFCFRTERGDKYTPGIAPSWQMVGGGGLPAWDLISCNVVHVIYPFNPVSWFLPPQWQGGMPLNWTLLNILTCSWSRRQKLQPPTKAACRHTPRIVKLLN